MPKILKDFSVLIRAASVKDGSTILVSEHDTLEEAIRIAVNSGYFKDEYMGVDIYQKITVSLVPTPSLNQTKDEREQ